MFKMHLTLRTMFKKIRNKTIELTPTQLLLRICVLKPEQVLWCRELIRVFTQSEMLLHFKVQLTLQKSTIV